MDAGSPPPTRSIYGKPFLFTLLVVSVLASKFLHLFSHLPSLPPVLFILYLPTFLIQDYIVIIVGRVLLFGRQPCGRLSWVLHALGGLLSLITLSASASQISFFVETRGEIHWGQAGNFSNDPAGVKMLLSGLTGFGIAAGAMFGLSLVVTPWLYVHVGRWLRTAISLFTRKPNARYAPLENFTDSALSSEDLLEKPAVVENPSTIRRWISRLKLLVPLCTIIILRIVRPISPYGHLSGTLPFTLLEGFASGRSEFCTANPPLDAAKFVFPELIAEKYWEQPDEGRFYRGWMPKPTATAMGKRPSWVTEGMMRQPGFEKWNDDLPAGRKPTFSYDPVLDPLKISNLDQPVFEKLQKAFGDIDIQHIVLITLESTRKDVFPLRKGSHLHKIISASGPHDDELAGLTGVAEILTGENTGFKNTTGLGGNGGWHGQPDAHNLGGVNIDGAVTGSTFTFKSMIGSHCGVAPLSVDFLEEVESPIYQPCLPHVLRMFNNISSSAAPWKSVFIQSITNKYDRQDELNRNMGFDVEFTSEELKKPDALYPPTEPESNYFGFPETQIKPYLHDLIVSAEEKNERLFLSHITSSTHHPWATPEAFGKFCHDYFRGERDHARRWRRENRLNKYLNTVRYCDEWLGQVLSMLEETGIANKTLVVMVGDHGMTFRQDDDVFSTYENGHITNFKVPLLFRHPLLPRMQISARASSMSIIPTILDLLVNTKSLGEKDTVVARHLVQEYEGQSLIRPFLPSKNGRQQWNFGVINPGGTFLAISSAAFPYRLVLPLCTAAPFRLTDIETDPVEKAPLEEWDFERLMKKANDRYGAAAVKWVEEAKAVGRWWVWESRRRWAYDGAARRDDRGAEHNHDGQLKKDKWWQT